MTKTMKKPSTVGLRDLRENMAAYVSKIEKGKSFLVLRKSKPIFKLSPVDEWGDEGHWTGVDLRDKNGNGMPVSKFMAIVKKVYDANRKVSKKT
jgi:antitoxin (DNA-binding transcriptional repressor) of toxin-antitoxin stability system